MKNRMGEFKREEGAEGGSGRTKIVDKKLNSTTSVEKVMAPFFKDVGQVNELLVKIRKNIDDMSQKYAESFAQIAEQDEIRANEEMEVLNDETQDIIRTTKQRLDAIHAFASSMKAKTDPNQVRMATTMHATLSRKFLDLMKEYNDMQTEMNAKQTKHIENQIRAVRSNASPEEIEEIMDAGEDVFKSAILSSGHEQAVEIYELAKEKNRDIHKIEQQLMELHQLFKDVYTLIEAQGHIIDSIEHNVEMSVSNMQRANVSLVKAGKSQRKSRKRMCCIGIIALIILGLILVFALKF